MKYTVETYFDSRDDSHSLRLSELYFANKYSIKKGINAIFEDRGKIEKNEIEFSCGYCKQPLCICGGGSEGKQRLHFRHKCYKESLHCIYEEQERLSEEEINRIKFNGSKESLAHKEIKEFIVQRLCSLGFSDIKQEKYIWDKCQPKSFRIGDVTGTYQDKEFVFEVQLSTTFLHVISGRTMFYEQNGKYLIWVFNNFSKDSNKQLFTQKDILVQNCNNVFVLDDEAKRLSIKENTLYFHCYYVDFQIEGEGIQGDSMKSKYVKFTDLTFRESDHKVYYIDTIKKHDKLKEILSYRRKRKEENQKKKEIQVLQDNEEAEKRRIIALYEVIKRNAYSIEKQIRHLSASEINYLREIILDDLKDFFFNRPYNSWETKMYDEILSNTKIAPCIHEVFEDNSDIQFWGIAEADWIETKNCQSHFAYYLKCCMRNEEDIASDTNINLKKYLSKYKNQEPSQTIKNIILRYSLMIFYQRIQQETSNINQQLDYFQSIIDNLKFITLVQSVFLGFIVGCNLPNLAAVTNYIKKYHIRFGHLFIKVIIYSNIERNSSLVNNLTKLEGEMKKNNYKKDTSLDKLFSIIFPKIQW